MLMYADHPATPWLQLRALAQFRKDSGRAGSRAASQPQHTWPFVPQVQQYKYMGLFFDVAKGFIAAPAQLATGRRLISCVTATSTPSPMPVRQCWAPGPACAMEIRKSGGHRGPACNNQPDCTHHALTALSPFEHGLHSGIATWPPSGKPSTATARNLCAQPLV
jgi:hypothetical protein